MACGLLALLRVAATASNSPSFVCNTQAQCIQLSVQCGGCFVLGSHKSLHACLCPPYHVPFCRPSVHLSVYSPEVILASPGWEGVRERYGTHGGVIVFANIQMNTEVQMTSQSQPEPVSQTCCMKVVSYSVWHWPVCLATQLYQCQTSLHMFVVQWQNVCCIDSVIQYTGLYIEPYEVKVLTLRALTSSFGEQCRNCTPFCTKHPKIKYDW